MLGTSWECHKVREFALRPMGDFLLVLDLMSCQNCVFQFDFHYFNFRYKSFLQNNIFFF